MFQPPSSFSSRALNIHRQYQQLSLCFAHTQIPNIWALSSFFWLNSSAVSYTKPLHHFACDFLLLQEYNKILTYTNTHARTHLMYNRNFDRYFFHIKRTFLKPKSTANANQISYFAFGYFSGWEGLGRTHAINAIGEMGGRASERAIAWNWAK